MFISEYVEGSCNTKAIELHNPTDVDITMNGTHLQWHHSDDFYGHQRDDEDTDVNANGYDIRLDGKTIPAGGTFVFCREQRVTSATDCTSPAGDAVKFPVGTNEQRLKPNGPCDMVVGSSAGCVEPYCNPSSATGNAVKHTGDDSIELRLDGRPACFNASTRESAGWSCEACAGCFRTARRTAHSTHHARGHTPAHHPRGHPAALHARPAISKRP